MTSTQPLKIDNMLGAAEPLTDNETANQSLKIVKMLGGTEHACPLDQVVSIKAAFNINNFKEESHQT